MAASLQDHPAQAELFIRNQERAHWHDQALWSCAKRDCAASALPEWELLRDKASAIKLHTLSRLADYLEQFADQAEQKGVTSTGRAMLPPITRSCCASCSSTLSPASPRVSRC